MFKSKFSKVCALILAFGISFSTCSMSYADSTVIGKPNSIHEEYNRDGSLKQRRQFGKNGQAEKDVDYSHGGMGHKFPHVHDWNWKDGKVYEGTSSYSSDVLYTISANVNIAEFIAIWHVVNYVY